MTTKTATILVRTEPDIKKAADALLARLGLTTSNAVNMFLHQVVEEKSLPFRPRLAQLNIPDIDALSPAEIKALLDEGTADIRAGRVQPFEKVQAKMETKYGFRI